MKQHIEYREPLFVLGSARSFTSLICAMLGQHPQAYGVPELNLFACDTLDEFLESMTGYRQIQLHGLIRMLAQVYGGEQTLTSMDMARRWMIPRLQCTTAEVYHELCERVAPLRIVDKSPAYAISKENLARIAGAFPNARYLHLTRNPRSQGASIMNVANGIMAILADSIDYTTDPPTVDPQISWLAMQTNIMEFLAQIPQTRWLTLRGEDFLNARDASLQLVCEWMGWSTDPAAIEAMLHPEDSPYASLGPIGAHLGNDINFLRSPALRSGEVACPPLAGPLAWREDGAGFTPEVLKVAQLLGYD